MCQTASVEFVDGAGDIYLVTFHAACNQDSGLNLWRYDTAIVLIDVVLPRTRT
jgi:hypothetical protein